jgi:hypothetical protein
MPITAVTDALDTASLENGISGTVKNSTPKRRILYQPSTRLPRHEVNDSYLVPRTRTSVSITTTTSDYGYNSYDYKQGEKSLSGLNLTSEFADIRVDRTGTAKAEEFLPPAHHKGLKKKGVNAFMMWASKPVYN